MFKNRFVINCGGYLCKNEKNTSGITEVLEILWIPNGTLITFASSYLSFQDGISTVCCRIPELVAKASTGHIPLPFLISDVAKVDVFFKLPNIFWLCCCKLIIINKAIS